jgi:uncharacterized protein involved in exopolysaccharide biosynthesis
MVGVLVRQWKSIAVWVFIVTVLAALVSLFLPKTYRAEALLLINPSPYKSSSLEQSPLDVDTYERMLRSPALIEEIRAALHLEKKTIENLLNKMKVMLIKRASQRETTYAPLLLLQVEGEQPEMCQAMANTWADLATSASLRIKGAALNLANKRIREQWKDTREVLQKKEDDLTTFDTSAQLIERKAELEMLRTQLASEQDNLESLRLQHALAQTGLEDLKRKYASFFVKGVWVGTLHDNDGEASAILSAAKVEGLPLQFLHARNDYVEKTREYTNYKIKKRVDITKRQYDILINKIIRFEQDIEDMKMSLATQKARLESLQSMATSVPERLVVRKAITDDSLWAALAKGTPSLDQITSKCLASEQTNPLWLSAQGRIQYLQPEIASLEARIQSHQKLLEQLREEQGKLDEIVVGQTQDTQNLETETRFAQDRYETLFQIYLKISHDIMFQEGEAARLHEEIANSEKQIVRLTSQTVSLVNYTVTKELDRERLMRDLTSVRNIYTQLAAKYEEARITELEVSGDLQMAFRAVLPEEKIKPKRSAIVGSAFLCALVFFSLLVIARDHIRQQTR